METVPGAFQIKCTCIFNNGSGGKTVSTVTLADVDIPKPDGIKIVSGDRVSVNAGTVNTTVLVVMSGGLPVDYLAGVAQEHITNARGSNNNLLLKDGGWVPRLIGNDPSAARFFLSGSLIIDKKGFPASNNFTNSSFPKIGMTAHQAFRIVIKDSCGNYIPCPLLPEYDVAYVKDSNNGSTGGTYQIQHTPPQ